MAAAWRECFPRQDDEFRRFPGQVVVAAVDLARRLLAGEHFSTLGGDRMRHDRRMVRFELPGFHRLVMEEDRDARAVNLRIMTHARYNKFFPGDRG